MTSGQCWSKDQILRMKSFFNIRFSIIAIVAILFTTSLSAQDKEKIAAGKTLFKANCASCHNPLVAGTGPALKGVTARWEAAGDHDGKTGKQWLHAWIKNWNTPVKANYEYAVKMSNFSSTQMNLFPGLSDDEIDNILLYVDNSGPTGPTGPTGDTSKPQDPKAAEEGPSLAVILFVSFLLLLVVILIVVTNQLDKAVAEKKGEHVSSDNKKPFFKSRKFIATIVIIGLVYLGYHTVDSAVHLGRQQGYQPAQPIKFSHQLHAGKHNIQCQYCHTGANLGKQSNIPSVNTCMNCHKNVQTGPETGTTEIAKIYAAAGWDVKLQKYVAEPKPIEWVRIHNLPDHVYFNHSQHVNAGKVECQTCHGPIETMKEVYQHAPLSMGWCINCHRQTEVQFASNNYYTIYEKLHEDLKNKKIEKVTVENIGGTECQKCHY